MYWSPRLPAIAREAGIRSLATLHDFWLICGRMGQLIDADEQRCAGPSKERCAPCLARTKYGQTPQASTWVRRLIAIRSSTGLALDRPLRALQRVRESMGQPDDAPEQAPDLPL